AAMVARLQAIMADEVGPFRTAAKLERALLEIAALADACGERPPHHVGAVELGFDLQRLEWFDLRNMLMLARAVAQSALARTESRGAHQREDYPQMLPAWRRHQRVRLAGGALQSSGAPAEALGAGASPRGQSEAFLAPSPLGGEGWGGGYGFWYASKETPLPAAPSAVGLPHKGGGNRTVARRESCDSERHSHDRRRQTENSPRQPRRAAALAELRRAVRAGAVGARRLALAAHQQRPDLGNAVFLHQRQCLQGMHDPARWRARLCLHRAARAARNDAHAAAEQDTDPRSCHRDRAALGAVQINSELNLTTQGKLMPIKSKYLFVASMDV